MGDIKLQVFDAQNEIIKLQSEIINEIFRLLGMHMEADELSCIPAVEKMDRVKTMRSEYQI